MSARTDTPVWRTFVRTAQVWRTLFGSGGPELHREFADVSGIVEEPGMYHWICACACVTLN